MIGDTVRAVMPIVYNESILGGRIRHFYYRVVELVRGPRAPDALVVILGTAESNNFPSTAEFTSDMRTFLDDVAPHVDCVRWFDTQAADANPIYNEFNLHHRRISNLIHNVVDEYGNVEYFHYGAWTDIAPPGYIDIDGLHLAGRGRIELGRMIIQAARGCDETTNVGGFWDVKTGYWADDAISWIVAAGLASGFPNDTYRARIGGLDPDVTRGQLASMVWRLADSPPASGRHRWSDGPSWLRGALDWLHGAHLATGYPDGTFRPGAAITRGEVVRLLWRLSGSPLLRQQHPWTDGAGWIDPALNWAVSRDLLAGYPDGTVRPRAAITRAQIAQLLFRFDSLPDPPSAAVPSEVTTAADDPSPTPATNLTPTTTAPAAAAADLTPSTTTGPQPTTAPTPTTVGG